MNLKINLKYIYEVLAIMVGITLSFMVDEWREEHQIDKKRKILLNNINIELKETDKMILRVIDRLEERLNYNKYFIDNWGNWNNDSIAFKDDTLKVHIFRDLTLAAWNSSIKGTRYESAVGDGSIFLLYNQSIINNLNTIFNESVGGKSLNSREIDSNSDIIDHIKERFPDAFLKGKLVGKQFVTRGNYTHYSFDQETTIKFMESIKFDGGLKLLFFKRLDLINFRKNDYERLRIRHILPTLELVQEELNKYN